MTLNSPKVRAWWSTAMKGAHVCLCALVLVCAASFGGYDTLRAEGLREALRSAYEANPDLDAERAQVRALDEGVAEARSGYRPTVTGRASVTRTHTETDPRSLAEGELTSSAVELNLTQPVFTGFRTTNAVNRAEAEVRVGRENLRQVESTTLLDAATAYLDIVRDTAILRLRERNISVLSRELEAAQARRAVLEVTITDVSQARARRARAVAEADTAKADLRISRATFLQVVGHKPRGLVAPPHRVANLPRSLNEALSIADQESPVIVAALYQEQAARFAVEEVWGELLPRVNLEANYSHETDPSRSFNSTDVATISGRLVVPFYQGGAVHARVRKAKHTHVSNLQRVERARARVESAATAAWSRLVAARARLNSARVQVSSARTALEGVREEEKVGQRTLLDVLNAEQEFLDAEVSRVIARRDLVVASYTLIASIGRLNAEWIDEIRDVYDPEVHYEVSRNKWIGVTITSPEPVVEAEIVVDVRPSVIEDSAEWIEESGPEPVADLFRQTLK